MNPAPEPWDDVQTALYRECDRVIDEVGAEALASGAGLPEDFLCRVVDRLEPDMLAVVRDGSIVVVSNWPKVAARLQAAADYLACAVHERYPQANA